MIWVLLHGDRIVARGSYAQILDTGEEWQIVERAWHRDGTELAPRWLDRGYTILPETMAGQRARRAA